MTNGGRCAVTGANGYVGGRIAAGLAAAGWTVVKLGRRDSEVAFELGAPVAPEALQGCDALVHCAYDFRPLTMAEIRAANVDGAARLFDGAVEAGIKKIVAISTISAFPGCRSRYGQAKLAIEAMGHAAGACIIRPGLVWGPGAGGMFGRLEATARTAKLVPMPQARMQNQYLVHHDDLAAAVAAGLDRASPPAGAVTVAHETPWPLPEIVRALAAAHGRKVGFLPAPWMLVWLGLRAAEAARLPLDMRSDSLISLVHQDRTPQFNAAAELGVACRPFDPASTA